MSPKPVSGYAAGGNGMNNVLHHPAFGNQPVVNTVRVHTDSRKRKVMRLTKVRRVALKQAREKRDRAAAEREAQREEDAKTARFVEEARERIPAERRPEICHLARDLAGLILRLNEDQMRYLIELANYCISRRGKLPPS